MQGTFEVEKFSIKKKPNQSKRHLKKQTREMRNKRKNRHNL
jgi:hypothetical protein